MLKTVSSITNAIGALNYKGTWDANANNPTLASSVGTKGDYYVVGTAGSTNLNGITNWGVGDWAVFNGSVWQRVEGGANLNGVDLSVSGTATLSGLTASTALALDASKNMMSVTNTGTGSNVLSTTPTLVGDVSLSTGNLVVGTSGKGIDFSATAGTGTSELLADYEEGTWTPVLQFDANTQTLTTAYGNYVKIGKSVTINMSISWAAKSGSGRVYITGLPFAKEAAGTIALLAGCNAGGVTTTEALFYNVDGSGTVLNLAQQSGDISSANISNSGNLFCSGTYFV